MYKEFLRDRRMDRLADGIFNNAIWGAEYTSTTGYKDLIRNEKEKSTISIAVPGISKDDVELEVKEEGLLTISFKKENDFLKTTNKSWTLPEDIDVENVTAECKDGLLTVTLPRVKRLPSTRKVQVL